MSSTTGPQPTTVPSGRAVQADFRCRARSTGHGLHADPELPQVPGELLDADPVRAPAEPDVGRAAGAQHVAAVERARGLDAGDAQAEVAHRPLDASGLAAAPGAPDRAMTARSPWTTTGSSTKTASGWSSAGSTSTTCQPAPVRASV